MMLILSIVAAVVLCFAWYQIGQESVSCEYSYAIPDPKIEYQCTEIEARAFCQRDWVEATRKLK